MLQTVSAGCPIIDKNKQTHSGKDEPTGSHNSRDSLCTSRRTYRESDYEGAMDYGGSSKKTFFAMINGSLNISRTTVGRWCYGWIRYLKISITSSSIDGNPAHNSKRTQVWLKKNLTAGGGEGDPGSQLP